MGVSILILPCLVFFLLESFSSVPHAIRALGDREMIVDKKLQRVDAEIVIRDWQATLRKATYFLAALLLVSVAEPVVEWAATSAWPLLGGGIEAIPEDERDWSVAALLRQEGVLSKTGNAAFSLLVFVIQIPMIASIVFLLGLTLLFCVFFSKKRDAWQIVPDDGRLDKRCGFQVFEDPISNLVLTALLALGMFYLSIIQNHYLRTEYRAIADFVVVDMVGGAAAVSDKDFDVTDLFRTRPSRLKRNDNISVGVSRLGGVVVLLFVLGVPLWILRGVAQRGATAMSSRGDTNDKPLAIQYWPLSYVSLNAYLLVCLVVGFSLFFYRIGLWVFGLLAGATLLRFLTLVRRGVSADDKP